MIVASTIIPFFREEKHVPSWWYDNFFVSVNSYDHDGTSSRLVLRAFKADVECHLYDYSCSQMRYVNEQVSSDDMKSSWKQYN